MPENPELRKLRDKRYENRKKENYDRMFIRIDKNLKNRFKEKIDKDDNYAYMTYFIIKNIERYLKNDYIVILNRYTSSNMAHQGSRYSDSEERFYMYQWIDKLEYWLLKLPKPDCTILLKVPAKYLNQLSEKQVAFNFQEDIFDQDSVLKAYIELSELYNWDSIDCVSNNKMKSVEEIHEEIMKIVRINLNN